MLVQVGQQEDAESVKLLYGRCIQNKPFGAEEGRQDQPQAPGVGNPFLDGWLQTCSSKVLTT